MNPHLLGARRLSLQSPSLTCHSGLRVLMDLPARRQFPCATNARLGPQAMHPHRLGMTS